MILAGIGILLSILGIFMVSTKEDAGPKELMFALNKGVYGSSILIAVSFCNKCYFLQIIISGNLLSF